MNSKMQISQCQTNKPDFDIKFRLGVDTKAKYLLNGFSYLGKDKTKSNDQPILDNVVLRLLEPYICQENEEVLVLSLKLTEKLSIPNTTILRRMSKSWKGIPNGRKINKYQL